jgi:secreted trypsin-like serine protease
MEQRETERERETISNLPFHAGIISNGITCAHPHYPGTYTDVAMFTAWIVANTEDSGYCNN